MNKNSPDPWVGGSGRTLTFGKCKLLALTCCHPAGCTVHATVSTDDAHGCPEGPADPCPEQHRIKKGILLLLQVQVSAPCTGAADEGVFRMYPEGRERCVECSSRRWR